MKKLVSLAVCLCLVLGLLAGCGGTQGAEIKGEVNLYTWRACSRRRCWMLSQQKPAIR